MGVESKLRLWFANCWHLDGNIVVADGVFYAELNEFFTRELAEEGYSGVEVRVTPTVTDISTYTCVRDLYE